MPAPSTDGLDEVGELLAGIRTQPGMSDDLRTSGVDFHCDLNLFPDHQMAIAKAEAAQIYAEGGDPKS